MAYEYETEKNQHHTGYQCPHDVCTGDCQCSEVRQVLFLGFALFSIFLEPRCASKTLIQSPLACGSQGAGVALIRSTNSLIQTSRFLPRRRPPTFGYE